MESKLLHEKVTQVCAVPTTIKLHLHNVPATTSYQNSIELLGTDKVGPVTVDMGDYNLNSVHQAQVLPSVFHTNDSAQWSEYVNSNEKWNNFPKHTLSLEPSWQQHSVNFDNIGYYHSPLQQYDSAPNFSPFAGWPDNTNFNLNSCWNLPDEPKIRKDFVPLSSPLKSQILPSALKGTNEYCKKPKLNSKKVAKKTQLDTANTSKKQKNVVNACTHCRKAHLGCDNQRPCRRCIHLKKTDCVDVTHKKRGRPKSINPASKPEEPYSKGIQGFAYSRIDGLAPAAE